MEWLLIVISIVLMLVNILLILTVKKQRIENESTKVQEKMAEFVAQLEEENNELYNKLTIYIKERENQLAERVGRLEQKAVLTIEKTDREEKTTVETEKIVQLSKQGFSSKQIAKVLQVDFGEVELIVNMNHKRHSSFTRDEVL
ncbi:DUF6115 domain-containing protein [Planococcus versutus]|uniref:Resolvase HTH domain-containing protein n=1 Tax=Planococcus versutus TaxID=1302659 RepID=A0A1B1S0K3_9BACL|nr:hypothetical protein [Planococcus versutus]ANU26706.1 hypothetical protein I858_006660 [Planococcus versutus]